jgi:hypothetical protein
MRLDPKTIEAQTMFGYNLAFEEAIKREMNLKRPREDEVLESLPKTKAQKLALAASPSAPLGTGRGLVASPPW